MDSNQDSGGTSVLDHKRNIETDVETLRRDAHHKAEAELAQNEELQQRQMAVWAEQMHRPVRVDAVQLQGAKNTRRSFLNPLIAPLVDKSGNGRCTLAEVIQDTREVVGKLERFEIFQPGVNVLVTNASEINPQAAKDDLALTFIAKERSRFLLKTGTDLGNTEGSGYVNLLWRNMLGGAEMLSVNASAGTRTRSAYSAVFSSPVNSNPDFRISLEGAATDTKKPWASHEEVSKGGTIRATWLSHSRDLHNLAYSANWRQITGLSGAASPTVRADAGDSMKSAITYTFTRDLRDNPMLPQSGYLVKAVTELAGVGPLRGDVAFSKSEVEVGGALPVPLPGVSSNRTGISIGGGLRFGLLYPLGLGWSPKNEAIPSLINDRFQLGGPNDVRGFKIGGLGPRDGNDSVGGDVFAAGSVNLLLPLPRTGVDSPLRLQIFANGGRLVAMQPKTTAREKESKGLAMAPSAVRSGMSRALGEMIHGLPSVSAGVGLVYAHPIARFELNFSLPLVMRRGEQGRKGLQVGVGINFL